MSTSKEWDWKQNQDGFWLEPSEESYYTAARWKKQGFQTLLDFGCGLGRHAIFFAKQGFSVSAFDLSAEAVQSLTDWASRESLEIPVTQCDMLSLPYADASFDCLYAFHVISHTDSQGIKQILSEISRVVRPNGEVFLTLCAKDTWSFCKADYPQIDANTVRKVGGIEDGIPHFYVDMDDIEKLFGDFELLSVKHTNDCWFAGKRQDSRHYFMLMRKRG